MWQERLTEREREIWREWNTDKTRNRDKRGRKDREHGIEGDKIIIIIVIKTFFKYEPCTLRLFTTVINNII